jgi:hypothetical protein
MAAADIGGRHRTIGAENVIGRNTSIDFVQATSAFCLAFVRARVCSAIIRMATARSHPSDLDSSWPHGIRKDPVPSIGLSAMHSIVTLSREPPRDTRYEQWCSESEARLFSPSACWSITLIGVPWPKTATALASDANSPANARRTVDLNCSSSNPKYATGDTKNSFQRSGDSRLIVSGER